MANVLYMTVGLPRIGKSTWARHQDIPMVNPDSIRKVIHGKPFDKEHENLVWWTAKIAVKQAFLAGHEKVILDATNLTKAARDQWIDPMWERIAVVFTINDLQTLRERAMFTNQEYLLPIIDRMAATMQPIFLTEEKFIHILDGNEIPIITK